MPARLRIGHKLTLALAVLLLTTVAVAVVGLSSVSDVNRRATALYADNIRTTETTSALWGGLYEAEESAFQLLLVSSAAERSELEDELDESVPKVESAIVALRQIHVSDAPVEKAGVEQIAAGWLEFERLWRSGALASGDPKARRRVIARVAAVLEPATELAAALAATEGREARESQARAEANLPRGQAAHRRPQRRLGAGVPAHRPGADPRPRAPAAVLLQVRRPRRRRAAR
jgi:hypothetical protein